MEEKINEFWKWLVTSSADPQKMSLAVKGFLGTAATVVTVVLGFANVHIGPDVINQVVDVGVAIVQGAVGTVSSVAFLWGLIRKISKTVEGTNHLPLP